MSHARVDVHFEIRLSNRIDPFQLRPMTHRRESIQVKGKRMTVSQLAIMFVVNLLVSYI